MYRFGPFRLDPAPRQLWRGDEQIHLQPKTVDVLLVLVQHAGHAVAKSDLLKEAWPGVAVDEANLSVHITALRRALGDQGEQYIETVPRHGYRFAAAVEDESRADTSAAPVHGAPQPAMRTSSRLRRGVTAALLGVVVIAGSYLALLTLWRDRAEPNGVIRSLVVVPFTAIGASGDQQHLEFGMADALITRLGTLQALRIPPTAALRQGEDPFDAGSRLNVDAVLTGTLQRADSRLRVTAQLSRMTDRSQVWAGVFDENLTDIFSVQDSIAERIAASVQRGVTARERAALQRRETSNFAAYELYLKGRERWSRRTMTTIQEAITMYESAIALDPEFALAYAGLADAYTTTASGLDPTLRYPRARAAAERAVALAPALAETHLALGFVSYKFEWRWRFAEQAFERALELDRHSSLAHHQFGELHKLLGRWDEAIADFERARELDPYLLHTRMDLQSMYLIRGRVAEARRLIEDGLQQDANSWEMNQGLGEVLQAEGRIDEAIEADLRSRELAGEDRDELEEMRAAYGRGGRPAYLRAANRFLLARFKRGDLSPKGIATSLATNFAELNDREQALHWLEIATDRQEEGPLYLNYRRYDFVRDDPRFKALYARVFGGVGSTSNRSPHAGRVLSEAELPVQALTGTGASAKLTRASSSVSNVSNTVTSLVIASRSVIRLARPINFTAPVFFFADTEQWTSSPRPPLST